MEFCDQHGSRIVYDSYNCPACGVISDLQDQISDLQRDIDNLQEEIDSLKNNE